MQICFLIEKKFKSASNEDANPLFDWKKFRSTSNEDGNQLIEKIQIYT